jgi:hypothetical protein
LAPRYGGYKFKRSGLPVGNSTLFPSLELSRGGGGAFDFCLVAKMAAGTGKLQVSILRNLISAEKVFGQIFTLEFWTNFQEPILRLLNLQPHRKHNT